MRILIFFFQLINRFLVKYAARYISPEALEYIFEEFNNRNYLISFNIRPSKFFIKNEEKKPSKNYNNHSVIIQGNIIFKNDFTLNSITQYLELFRGADIILSTWDEYSSSQLKPFYELGVHVLLNEKPQFSGLANVNLQIKSTLAGLNFAIERGNKYAIKTRTDQRIFGLNIIDGFLSLQNCFYKHENNTNSRRIITCSLGSYANRLYSLSDMFQFGRASDLKLFWSADFQLKSEIENFKLKKNISHIESIQYLPEVYLMTSYINKMGIKVDWTYKQSTSIIANHFIVVDRSTIDLYWNKYTLNEKWKEYYNSKDELVEYSFKDWVINFNNNYLIN
jgi:hypothetical protein